MFLAVNRMFYHIRVSWYLLSEDCGCRGRKTKLTLLLLHTFFGGNMEHYIEQLRFLHFHPQEPYLHLKIEAFFCFFLISFISHWLWL